MTRLRGGDSDDDVPVSLVDCVKVGSALQSSQIMHSMREQEYSCSILRLKQKSTWLGNLQPAMQVLSAAVCSCLPPLLSCIWQQAGALSGLMPRILPVPVQAYQTPEQLDKNNEWYCSKCKEHVQATKKLDIWSLPEVSC